jgi:hypothetical protein
LVWVVVAAGMVVAAGVMGSGSGSEVAGRGSGYGGALLLGVVAGVVVVVCQMVLKVGRLCLAARTWLLCRAAVHCCFCPPLS